MNTARIVVLTIAVGAGSVAACPASGADTTPAPVESVARLQTVDVFAAASDIGLSQTVADTSDDQAAASGSIKLVRSGVSTPTKKRPKGRPI
jgi:hypothetical protein